MKFLFLAENPDLVTKLLLAIPNIKIITETEVISETPWIWGFIQPGYSSYLVSRIENLCKIYTYKKTLVFVIDQRHRHAVSRVPCDYSVRVYKNSKPNRLDNSVTYTTDLLLNESSLSVEKLSAIIS